MMKAGSLPDSSSPPGSTCSRRTAQMYVRNDRARFILHFFFIAVRFKQGRLLFFLFTAFHVPSRRGYDSGRQNVRYDELRQRLGCKR